MLVIVIVFGLVVAVTLVVGISVGVAESHHRKGIYTFYYVSTDTIGTRRTHGCTVRVTELEDLGSGFSIVRVDSISGAEADALYDIRRMIGDTVPTDKVKWLPKKTKETK